MQTKPPKINPILFSLPGVLFLLIVGLVPIKFGYDYYRKAQHFMVHAVQIKTAVIRYDFNQACRGGSASESRFPVVRVPDANGNIQEVCTNVGSSHESYQRGEIIPVAYDPHNLTDLRENNFWGLWFLPALFFFPGLAFVLLAIFRLIQALL